MPAYVAHDPKAVANYLLDCAREDGEALTPMKLIKLVYLCHGWHLGLTGQPLIRENVEAWRYGPVVPSLYYDLREFGDQAVARYAFWRDRVGGKAVDQVPKLTTASPSTLALIKRVWQNYKPLSGIQLSALTHTPGTPWYTMWHDRGASNQLGVDIPNDLIRDHYKQLASQRQ